MKIYLLSLQITFMKTAKFVYIVNFHSKWTNWYSLKHMISLSNKKILCWKIHFLLTKINFLVTASRAFRRKGEKLLIKNSSTTKIWTRGSDWNVNVFLHQFSRYLSCLKLLTPKIGEDKTKIDLLHIWQHFWEYELKIQTKIYLHSHKQMFLQKAKCIEKRICWKLSDASCSPALLPGSKNSFENLKKLCHNVATMPQCSNNATM